MLGGKIIKRQQGRTIFGQALSGLPCVRVTLQAQPSLDSLNDSEELGCNLF